MPKKPRAPTRFKGVRLKFDFALLYNEPFEAAPRGSFAPDGLEMMKTLRDRLAETIDTIEKRDAGKPWKVDRALVLNAWSFSLLKAPPEEHPKPTPQQLAIRAGDRVDVLRDNGEHLVTVARSEPWQLCGTWVVLVEGIVGGFMLTRVRPVEAA